MNNLDLMQKRLQWQGGIEQEDRMIKDKYRTLQRVLKYSYQACIVRIVQPREECPLVGEELIGGPPQKALINPDKVKQDYDDKIISIPYESNFKPGDIFEWSKTDTRWIIYTREITEDAYFRGEIRRCRHIIKFKDKEGNTHFTWAAIRGPVETQIDSIQKNQERIDRPNLSLNILIPRNELTLSSFDRYAEFLFEGRCWRVEAPDTISMDGVIELAAEENYINTLTDDVVNEIKDGLVIEKEQDVKSEILGNSFIMPKTPEVYKTCDGAEGTWSILENVPVKLCPSFGSSTTVSWNKVVSGQFTLQWTDGQRTIEKTVVVESLY